MEAKEIRLRLIEAVVSRSSNLSPDVIVGTAKTLEAFVNGEEPAKTDKAQAPDDSVKERPVRKR